MEFDTWLDTVFSGFDYGILSFFSTLQSGFINETANFITFFGTPEFTRGVAIFALLLCFFKKTRKIGLALVFAILIGTLLTNVLLKPLVMRARPYITYAKDILHDWYVAAGAHIESDRSFPSGHTTAAFEMATVLFLSFRKKWSWIFLLLALMIAMTRLYFMVHYPTDIIAGLVIGVFAGTVGFLLMKLMYRLFSKIMLHKQ